jgi:hypothetical protein
MVYCLELDTKIETGQNAVLRGIIVSQELSDRSIYSDSVGGSP